MYKASTDFNKVIRRKSRRYFWTGEIILKTGKTINFDDKHIIKDSGYITNSCSGNNEIELGSVYAAEMGVTLKMDELKEVLLDQSIVKLYFNLILDNGSIEKVPLGIFETYEANRTKKFIELKCYDYMVRFNKTLTFKETFGTVYELLSFCCKKCKVELGMTKEDIEKLPNGTEILGIYAEHDIETYRDLIHYIAATTATFSTIDRYGKLQLKKFTQVGDYEIKEIDRYELSISDFTTRYSAIQSTNLKTKISEYYANENDSFLTMNIGVNPLMQLGLPEKRTRMCKRILAEISLLNYTPLDSVIVSDPTLEVGDSIIFKIGEESYPTIITTIEYKIHGKYRIKSVGKNSLFSGSKSKQDKNIQGILKTIESDKVKVNNYLNTTELTILNTPQTIIDIEFASNKETDAFFVATLLIKSEGERKVVEENFKIKNEMKELTLLHEVSKKQEVTLSYSLNELVLPNHTPKTEYESGNHILTLFYPIIKLKENVLNRFTVDISVDNGKLIIPVEGVSAAVIGSALGGDIPWDGKIKVNENIGKLTLRHKQQVEFVEGEFDIKVVDVPKYEFSDEIIKNDFKRKFIFANLNSEVKVEEKNER